MTSIQPSAHTAISSPLSSTSISDLASAPPGKKYEFEMKKQGEPPSTTFYQLIVQSEPEKLVILREWPRLRYSQRQNKHAADPLQREIEWYQLVEKSVGSQAGDGSWLETKIRSIYGPEILDKVKETILQLL